MYVPYRMGKYFNVSLFLFLYFKMESEDMKILKVISIILLIILAGYWYFEYPHVDNIKYHKKYKL